MITTDGITADTIIADTIIADTIIVLGIETSCDDTSIAVLQDEKCLSHLIASQDHNKFGGILPEYAARNHLKALPNMIKYAMDISNDDLSAMGNNLSHDNLSAIDVIAVTYAPGLLGSLMVGTSYAKALAWSLGKKLVGVHHIEAHILIAQYDCEIPFPYGALVASGGHTILVIVESLGNYQILGVSLDDAAGECLDKIAREIGLSQPGGPLLEKLARTGTNNVPLPIPLRNDGSCNFSFSGLKTAAIKAAREGARPEDLSASVQHTIALTLSERMRNAINKRPDIKNWALVGGVAANQHISSYLGNQLESMDCKLYTPSPSLCTDNGLMIAYAGLLYAKMGMFSELDLEPQSTLRVDYNRKLIFPHWNT